MAVAAAVTAAAAAAAAAAATTTPATTTPGGMQPVLEHCCDRLIRGSDTGGARGEEKAILGVDLPFNRGKEWGECSTEGDRLRAEGEFLVFTWLVLRTTGESRV